jgi:hypothetical protein
MLMRRGSLPGAMSLECDSILKPVRLGGEHPALAVLPVGRDRKLVISECCVFIAAASRLGVGRCRRGGLLRVERCGSGRDQRRKKESQISA